MQDLKKLTIKKLRQKAQRNAPEAGRDPWVGLTIRFFSVYITKLLIRTKITANQVTAVSVLFFFIGILLFVFHSYILYFYGIFLIYLSVILDGCDGEIARLKGAKIHVGGTYTEPISHDIQYGFMFIPLSLNAYFISGSIVIIYIGFIGAIAKLLYRFMIIRFDNLILKRKSKNNLKNQIGDLAEFKKDVNIFHKLYRFLNRNFFSSVGLVIPLLFFAILNRIDLFVWTFSVFYSIVACIVFFKQTIYISKLKS